MNAFQQILDWIFDNKVVTLLSVLLFSFFVATISVAVQSSNRQDELDTCLIQLDRLTTTEAATTKEVTTPMMSTEPEETTTMTSAMTTQVISTTSNSPPNGMEYRLPTSVVPKSYAVKLNPDLEKSVFIGNVGIVVDVLEDTDSITLHSDDLDIKTLTVKNVVSGELLKGNFTLSKDDKEMLVHRLEKILPKGEYEIQIDYEGSLSGIVGFYGSTLKNQKKMASSKFEPTYARKAFPCFDEPAMKATYDVQIVTPKDYIALSNMNEIKREELTNETSLVTFDKSVPMSSYLLCFIVCDFKNISTTINSTVGDDFTFRVFAADGQLDKVEFPMEVGKRVTEYYIDYFKISYPLPKLDMIAIPDFVSGAMEHWGLVTFRETNLLYDKTTTSTSNKQNIARVVAHEISHMWFGNLVTMNWWNDLWLNEGFASYMQYKALDKLYPEWRMLEQFLGANSHSIFALDGTLSSHPIVQTVDTPDEITAIFDSITYNKGAAVIRMLENFIGEDDFQSGISNYLDKYKYKNTITQNLIDELADIFEPKNENLNLTYIMDTWTRQMGLPVVEVTKINDTQYKLTQKRFLANPSNKPDKLSDYNDRWFIPITFRTDKNTSDKVEWFSDSVTDITLNVADGEKLLKLNNDQVGYYRVNYPKEMWLILIEEMTSSINDTTSTLSVSDRSHLINDVFTLAEASEVEYELALDLSKYLLNEIEYAPWSVASSQFKTMKEIMSNSIAFVEFKAYVRSLLVEIYKTMNWEDSNSSENDEHVEKLLRSSVLSLACSMGNSDALMNAKERFTGWLNEMKEKNESVLDPDLKNTVYYYGIESTGEEEWLDLWDIFLKEDDAQEISKLMSALTASKDPAILKRYLNLAWEENYIRAQDHLTVISEISANPIGTPIVWDHVRENWDRLVEKFTLNSRTLGNMIPSITKSFATQSKLNEVEEFFTANPEAGAGAAGRERAKENIKNNIAWLKTHEPSVSKWLQEQK